MASVGESGPESAAAVTLVNRSIQPGQSSSFFFCKKSNRAPASVFSQALHLAMVTGLTTPYGLCVHFVGFLTHKLHILPLPAFVSGLGFI